MADQDSPTTRRTRLQDYLERLDGCDDKVALAEAVRDVLTVLPPDGSSEVLDHLANSYRRQADGAEEVANRVGAVGGTLLPNVWAGESGAKAAEAVSAAARDADHMSQAFREAYKTLTTFADALHDAQAADSTGRKMFFDAFRILGSSDALADDQQGGGSGGLSVGGGGGLRKGGAPGSEGGGGLRKNDVSESAHDSEAAKEAISHARTAATAGTQKRLTAAAKVEEAARVATRDLNKLASEARAGRLRGSGLSNADALALADTAVAGAPNDLNKLLSVDDLQRSEQMMRRLNSDDHAKFNQMLSDAKSPEERAYLVKALAAGHTMDSLSTFQSKIHGRDPLWLRDHLSPVTTDSADMKDEGVDSDGANNNNNTVVTFHGQRWAQGGDGSDGTCVASSTINARAMADPVYALDLTGGPSGHDESPKDFRDRLVAEQHRVHTEGGGGKDWNGMDEEGQEKVDDREIGVYTKPTTTGATCRATTTGAPH